MTSADRDAAPVGALVFDFDGTIVDTETPVYESWAAAYRHVGMEPIPLGTWLEWIGRADDGLGLDVRGLLCEHLGVSALPDDVEAFRKKTCDDLVHAEALRPGVMRWIEAAHERGIPLAVASSSGSEWVDHHLDRLDLAHHFRAVSCAGNGVPGKPDPTVYMRACAAIGVDPARALAIEDSSHGVQAAVDAGMRCIAAPGPMTRSMVLHHAHVRVDSLAELDPTDWLSG